MKIRTPLAGAPEEEARQSRRDSYRLSFGCRLHTLVHFPATSRAIWQRSAGYADFIGQTDRRRILGREETYGDRLS